MPQQPHMRVDVGIHDPSRLDVRFGEGTSTQWASMTNGQVCVTLFGAPAVIAQTLRRLAEQAEAHAAKSGVRVCGRLHGDWTCLRHPGHDDDCAPASDELRAAVAS